MPDVEYFFIKLPQESTATSNDGGGKGRGTGSDTGQNDVRVSGSTSETGKSLGSCYRT